MPASAFGSSPDQTTRTSFDQDRVRLTSTWSATSRGESPANRVVVVNCKSWQSGFDSEGIIAQLNGDRPNPPGQDSWKQFRKLSVPKWSEAFRQAARA